MPSLYVMETGSRIEIERQRILVTRQDEVLLRLPLYQVSQVVLIGQVGVTTPALHRLLELNIPIIFLGHNGNYLGQVAPALCYNLPLRLAQFKCNDDDAFAIAFARSLVAGKINNQYVQACRWARHREIITDNLLQELKQTRAQVHQASEISSLLGIEGNAAKIYFKIMRSIIEPQWRFHDRNRRPPKDPVNGLLGFGYTLLTHAMSAALQIAGLDPYLGYFHTEGFGKPALALDLVEEFRAPVIDALVVALIALRQITTDDFEQDRSDGAVILKQKARREFVRQFGLKLGQPIKTREIGRPLTYQKHFEVQSRKVVALITGKASEYHPFMMR